MLLSQWICAHLIGDFLLQSGKMVRHKQRLRARSWMLYVHALVHGVLVYLVTAQWQLWWIFATVAVTHFFIDWWKLTRPENGLYFVIDQGLHLLVLLVLWCCMPNHWPQAKSLFWQLLGHQKLWPIMAGYLLLIWPFSMAIGFVAQRWRPDVATRLVQQQQSLPDAGRWIGACERTLVYTFIITQHFAAFGFLITAKSILRFNDTQKEGGRKEAEYILIGTLLSFSVAIITGLVVHQLIK